MRSVCLIVLLAAGCASKTLQKPFYYEVSKGGDNVGHLFGTVHVDVTEEEIPKQIFADVKKAGIVAVESSREFDKEIATELSERPHKPLKELLSQEEMDGAHAWIEHAVGRERTDRILQNATPLQLFIVLAALRFQHDNESELRDLMHASKHSILDVAFEKAGREAGVPVAYLDTKEESYRALDCILKSDEQLAKDIRAVLTGQDPLTKELKAVRKLVADYRLGDAEKLAGNVEAVIPEKSEKAYSCVLRDRNEKWLPKIVTYFRAYDRPFIAIGVLHIEAKHDSLRELLEKEGYTVKRIDAK